MWVNAIFFDCLFSILKSKLVIRIRKSNRKLVYIASFFWNLMNRGFKEHGLLALYWCWQLSLFINLFLSFNTLFHKSEQAYWKFTLYPISIDFQTSDALKGNWLRQRKGSINYMWLAAKLQGQHEAISSLHSTKQVSHTSLTLYLNSLCQVCNLYFHNCTSTNPPRSHSSVHELS